MSHAHHEDALSAATSTMTLGLPSLSFDVNCSEESRRAGRLAGAVADLQTYAQSLARLRVAMSDISATERAHCGNGPLTHNKIIKKETKWKTPLEEASSAINTALVSLRRLAKDESVKPSDLVPTGATNASVASIYSRRGKKQLDLMDTAKNRLRNQLKPPTWGWGIGGTRLPATNPQAGMTTAVEACLSHLQDTVAELLQGETLEKLGQSVIERATQNISLEAEAKAARDAPVGDGVQLLPIDKAIGLTTLHSQLCKRWDAQVRSTVDRLERASEVNTLIKTLQSYGDAVASLSSEAPKWTELEARTNAGGSCGNDRKKLLDVWNEKSRACYKLLDSVLGSARRSDGALPAQLLAMAVKKLTLSDSFDFTDQLTDYYPQSFPVWTNSENTVIAARSGQQARREQGHSRPRFVSTCSLEDSHDLLATRIQALSARLQEMLSVSTEISTGDGGAKENAIMSAAVDLLDAQETTVHLWLDRIDGLESTG